MLQAEHIRKSNPKISYVLHMNLPAKLIHAIILTVRRPLDAKIIADNCM